MNILAMKDITSKFRVTMDTDVEDGINVHIEDGCIMKFNQVKSGLYMLQRNNKNKTNKGKISA